MKKKAGSSLRCKVLVDASTVASKWHGHTAYAHAAITLATGDANFFSMAFLSFPKRGFDSRSKSFLPRGWYGCRAVFPS